MASRKDVANMAGVSESSVSYYINNSGYVSKEARDKIQNAIEKLNYTPNQIARSLKIKDSKQFLFFCNEIRNPFYSEIVYSATISAKKVGHTIMFTCVMDDDEYIKKMCGYQISGIFVSNNRIKLKHINQMTKLNVPIIMLCDVEWKSINSNVVQIKVDCSKIMKNIHNHLKKEGYKNIVYISSSHSAKKEQIDEKTKNFQKVNGSKENTIYNVLSAEEAYHQITSRYNKKNCPNAFVCTNDAVAMGVMKGIFDIGLKIPDVGVVGFDNSLNSNFASPSLTTVDIQMSSIGDIVIDLLMKKKQGNVVENYIIEPKLIVRESSSCS